MSKCNLGYSYRSFQFNEPYGSLLYKTILAGHEYFREKEIECYTQSNINY